MEPKEYFRESLKAARYCDYQNLINDDNSYSTLWRRKFSQLQELNTLLTAWMTSAMPFLSTTIPPHITNVLREFFSNWIQSLSLFNKEKSEFCSSSVLCGYYAVESVILLAQGPLGKNKDLAREIIIPLARHLAEITWNLVILEQSQFTFANLTLPTLFNSHGHSAEKSFIALDVLLLIQNAQHVSDNLKITLEELFSQ